jgi:hypothetical protein
MLKLIFFAVLAMPASAQEQEEKWQRPDARAQVTISNLSRRPVTVAMYSQNRIGHKWEPWEVTGELPHEVCRRSPVSSTNTSAWAAGLRTRRPHGVSAATAREVAATAAFVATIAGAGG